MQKAHRTALVFAVIFAGMVATVATPYTPLLEEECSAASEHEDIEEREKKSIASVIEAFKKTKGTFNISIHYTPYAGRVIALFNKKTKQLCVVVESRKSRTYSIIAPADTGKDFHGEVLTPRQFMTILARNEHWRGYAMPSAKADGGQLAGGITCAALGLPLAALGFWFMKHRVRHHFGYCYYRDPGIEAAGGGIAMVIGGIIMAAAVNMSGYGSNESVYHAAKRAVGEKYEAIEEQQKITLLAEQEAPSTTPESTQRISLLPEGDHNA